MPLSAYKLRKWSVLVRWRDRRCQLCGSRESLQAHHINSKSYFPEEAYDLDNGITLCGNNEKDGNLCHMTFHALFMQGTRRKCTTEDWGRFVRLVGWSREIAEVDQLPFLPITRNRVSSV